MWEFVCQQNIFTRICKAASRPVGLEGIVALLDGHDASHSLRFCNTVKFIWSGKVKQMKARLVWNYFLIYMSTYHIQTDI